MANLYITAVQYSNTPHKHISFVCLHSVDANNNLVKGRHVSKDYVLGLLGTNSIFTLRWNYTTAEWKTGALVESERTNGALYLRSDPNTTVEDNLSHLPILATWM